MDPNTDQEVRSAIHNYFREFGYELAETIYGELMKPGGIQRLLRRLGLEDPGHPDDQYAAVLNYLRRHGEDKFLDAIGQGSVDYRPTLETDTNKMRQLEERQKELVKRQYLRRSGVLEKKQAQTAEAPPKPKPPAAPAEVPQKQQEPEPATAAPAPAREEKGQPPGTLSDGSWDGVTERRGGTDRRTGRDRRQEVEMVFQNRRFGGDRRAGKERRRNWPPAEWPPSDTEQLE